ncbi:MAG TPA: glycerate kinase [Prolixibacteraceae bacterium]|nr:glycerate kinase [Prolixibacteraceae bacterium]
MKRILIAPDSFKECLTATQVAFAISKGIKRVIPEAKIISIPFADGGEGTVDALVTVTEGKRIITSAVDALNRPIRSFFGVLGNGKTAVIEMAAASGIELLTPEERNPLITSTFGTGLLLKAAMEAGFTQIIIGIGGSATNDGGAGMAQALGFRLLDKNGDPIGPGGGSLGELHSIDQSNVHPLLRKVKITVASDVRNPLSGPSGATRVYGPQKGATPEMLDVLEKNLIHFAHILHQEFEINISELPGTGAAGGLGAGLMVFCNAKIVSGFELICQLTQLENQIKKAMLVFTAEGKIDSQTALGKTISGVAQLAKKHKVPVIALAGIVIDDLTELYSQGVTSVFPIGNEPMSLEESKARAEELLSGTSERVMRLALSLSEK